jgi:hypothetical protein
VTFFILGPIGAVVAIMVFIALAPLLGWLLIGVGLAIVGLIVLAIVYPWASIPAASRLSFSCRGNIATR